MTSSQWCFLPKVGVDGELISKKRLSPKICERGTVFLLTAHCLALPKVQSVHILNVLATWIPRPLVVDLVMALDGWSNSTWKSLMLCLGRAVADSALSLLKPQRKSTPVTQPSQILIWRSSTILFHWSLEILFPRESSHLNENRFTPAAIGQNVTGYRVWTCSLLLTWHTITSYLGSIHWCQWCHKGQYRH